MVVTSICASFSRKNILAVGCSVIVVGAIIVSALVIFGLPDSQKNTTSGNLKPPCTTPPSDQLAVATSSGTVVGKLFGPGTLRTFFGIPFGKDTSGENRFKSADHLTSFSGGNLSAYRHGQPCSQLGELRGESSEDCLSLSIWAPAACHKDDPRKTVVFVVSGSWFQKGSTYDHASYYVELATIGDLIVVTANYRLGPMGFLNPGSEDVPGNAAFADVLMAYTWIRNNVEAFHGDAESIVAMGLGAGGTLLSVSLREPGERKHQRYFKRAIIHGLSFETPLPINNIILGDVYTRELAKHAGCSNEGVIDTVVTCLRNVTAGDVLGAASSILPLRFVPSFDRPPLPELRGESIEARLQDKLDLMCGFSEAEAHSLWDDIILPTIPKDMLMDLSATFARGMEFFLVEKFNPSQICIDDEHKSRLAEPNYKGFHDYLADLVVTCPMIVLARKSVKANNKVYNYVHLGPSKEPWRPPFNVEEIVLFAKTG